MTVFKGKKLSSGRALLAYLSLLAFKWTFVQKPSQQAYPYIALASSGSQGRAWLQWNMTMEVSGFSRLCDRKQQRSKGVGNWLLKSQPRYSLKLLVWVSLDKYTDVELQGHRAVPLLIF